MGRLRFWRWFATHSFSAVGALVVVVELVQFAFPSWGHPSGALTIAGVGVVSVLYGIFRAWPRPITQEFSSPKVKIEIARGDILDESGHVVVGACDTFDTIVPNVISDSSLQGKAQRRFWGNDVDQLDAELSVALTGVQPVERIAKPGKTDKYPIGTVAALKQSGRRIYFLAYSEMNLDNEAHASIDGIWHSLSNLWREVSRTANGSVVSVPIIGGGRSRISQVLPAQDAIRLVVMSFMFASRSAPPCDGLRIVVEDEQFDRLDHLELRAFLASLKPS